MTDKSCKTFNIEPFFGSAEIISEDRWDDNGDLLKGGYSIYYDRNGVETSRTEWEPTIRVYLDGGSGTRLKHMVEDMNNPYAREERIEKEKKEMGFWKRLFLPRDYWYYR